MKFDLIDAVLEQSTDRIVAIKLVSSAEEYLADHFPGFPILPGVMMLETMVQAARIMLADHSSERVVLGTVRALKYGAMVRPGDGLEVEITLQKELPGGVYQCRGTGRVLRGMKSGRLTGGKAVDGAGGMSTGTSPGTPAGPTGGKKSESPDETAVSGRFTMRPIRVHTQENDDHGHEPNEP